MEPAPDVIELLRLLLGLRDLDGMGDVALLDLARDARTETLKRGQTLQADEHLDRHVYLIEGEVRLEADGKTLQSVSAGTERAKLPVFRVHTHGLAAHSVGKTRLLSLNQATFDQYAATLRPQQVCGGITVEEFAADDSHASLAEEIKTAFYHREVDLPSLPEMATAISQAVQSDEADFKQIATTVQADPAIAARIVQVANSALYAGVNRVESLKNAITRIGLQATRVIVMSVVLKSLYTPQHSAIRKSMRGYYRQSIRTGALCHALARHLPGFDADQAFLAGLIHRIGTLPVLIQADRHDALNQDAGALERVIGELAAPIGALLLEQWAFEPQFITAARDATTWLREADRPDYCDIVQVAQLHCPLVGGQKVDAPPLAQLPAFKRLGMDAIDPMRVVEDARQDIQDIVSLLE